MAVPPSSPQPHRRLGPHAVRVLKLVGRWLAIVLLTGELLYLLAINAILNLPVITSAVDTDDIGMKWAYAVSLIPGRVTVHGFFMRLQDPNIQFNIKIGVAHARFTFEDLLHRTFHITRVDGEHAVYLMRMRRTPEEVAHTDLSTLPMLEGFPAVPLRRAVEPPPSPPATPEEVAAIWTVHIEGVHMGVDEGWFEGLRYQGPSFATGSFTLKPQHLVIVDAQWQVTGGGFTLRKESLAVDVHGEATVLISPFDPSVTPGNQPLRYLDGKLTLEGRLSNARFLNPVLAHTSAPHFSSDEGAFEVNFHFDRGQVGLGTDMRLHAKGFQIGRGRYEAKADFAQIESSVEVVDGVPTSITRIDLGPYQARRTPNADDPGGDLLTGDGMWLRFVGTQLDMLGPFLLDLGYELVLHEAHMSDLRRLNPYLPGAKILEVLGGEGTISGDYISPADDNGHGNLDITATDAAVRVQRVRFGGDVQLHLDLTGVASNSQRLVVFGTRPLGAKGHLEGHFRVRRPGDLTAALPPMGTCELTSDLTIDPLSRPELARQGFWHFLSAEASLKGGFDGLGFISGLLPGPTPLTISGGAGSFTLESKIEHGRVSPDTRASLIANSVQVGWGNYQAAADAHLAVGLRSTSAEHPLEAKLDLLSARLQAGGDTLFVADDISFTGSSTRLEMVELVRARPALSLRTLKARIPELRALNRYLPDGPLRMEGGSAEFQLEVSSPPIDDGRGSLTLVVKKASATYGDVGVSGDFTVTAKAGGLGAAPWREGIWDRTRLSSTAQLDGHFAVRPGAGSHENGVASLEVKASGEVPPLPAGTTPNWREVLANLTARGTLDGELQGIGYLNRFLEDSGWHAEGGSGSVNASLGLSQGEVTAGSWAHLKVAQAALHGGSFALAANTDVTAVVGSAGPNRLSLGLGLDSYELRYVPRSGHPAEDPVLLHGTGLRLEARSDDLDPARVPDVASVHAELGDVRVPDLRALNLFLPPSSAASITGGQALLTGTLDKTAHGTSKARLQLQGTQTTFELEGHQMSGDFRVTATAATAIPRAGWALPKSVDLSGSSFVLKQVSFGEGSDLPAGWWFTLELLQASLGMEAAPVAVGKVSLSARDLKPVFVLFHDQLGIPGILTPYLAFDEMHGGASLLVQPEYVEVTGADLQSTRLRLRGRLLTDSLGTRGQLLLNDPPMAYGIALHLHGTGLQLLGAEGWYQDQLRTPLSEDR